MTLSLADLRRKRENISMDDLRPEATSYDIPTQGLDRAELFEAVKRERERRWLDENRHAIESYNKWVEENGLPLARYRCF